MLVKAVNDLMLICLICYSNASSLFLVSVGIGDE